MKATPRRIFYQQKFSFAFHVMLPLLQVRMGKERNVFKTASFSPPLHADISRLYKTFFLNFMDMLNILDMSKAPGRPTISIVNK